MSTKAIIGLILLAVLVSGCSQNSSQNLETITLQECQSKDGQAISITLNAQDNSIQKCPQNQEFAGILEVSDNSKICCIPNEQFLPQNPSLQDQCISNSDCNDNDACTTDICTTGTPSQYVPAQCLNSQITSCLANDGCCPANCNWKSDSDCELVDLCQNSTDCNDENPTTNDTCTGNPKTCSNSLKTCSELGGKICANSQICSDNTVEASNTSTCCLDTCIGSTTIDTCSNINCPNNQKCVNGACVLKTCNELGGNFCTGYQYCPQEFVTSSDSSTCCPTTCTNIENLCEGLYCPSDHKCVNGACIRKTCNELNGSSCPSSANTCDGLRYYYPDESLECCVGACNPRPTCDSLGGTFCSETLCEGSSQNTYDTPGNDICCTGSCHVGFCGVDVSQTTAEQYLNALLNDNYNQFVSVYNHDCSENPSSCQSWFESQKAKAQAYDSIVFDRVTEGTEGFTSVYFDLASNGQPAVTFQTRQNYILGGCRIASTIWYT